MAAVAEPAVIPEPVAVVAAEPEAAPEPEEPEDAGIAVDEGVEQLASLAEQVIYEAEAIAGEAAHNFQVAFKAVTDAQSVVPALSGINTYLHRSVRINAQFVEEFAGVRSPVDLVTFRSASWRSTGSPCWSSPRAGRRGSPRPEPATPVARLSHRLSRQGRPLA